MKFFKKTAFFLFLFIVSSATIYSQFGKPSFQEKVGSRELRFGDTSDERRLKSSQSLTQKSRQQSLSQKRKRINVHFSPEAFTAGKLIELIDNARSKIYVAIYWITDEKIAEALIHAKRERNIDVQIVTDQSCLTTAFIKKYEKISLLYENEIAVFVWIGESIMHNKFALFDDNIVWTGSYNWTIKADERNKENVIILEGFDIYKKYKEEFEIIKSRSFSFEIYHEIMQRINNISSSLDLSRLDLTSQQFGNLMSYLESKNVINDNLKHLNISHNNIVYFHEKHPNFQEGDNSLEPLEVFKKLKYLDLSHNNLEFIPYTFKSLNPGIYLNLKGNPLRKEMGILRFLPKINRSRGGKLLID